MLTRTALLVAAIAAGSLAVSAQEAMVLLTPAEAAEAAACWAEAPVLRAGLAQSASDLDSLRLDATALDLAVRDADSARQRAEAARLAERSACGRLADALRDERDAIAADLRRARRSRWIERAAWSAVLAGTAYLALR